MATASEHPLLVVLPAAERPPPETMRRLNHEYSLAAELEPTWAAKPLGRCPPILADNPRNCGPGSGLRSLFFSGTGGSPSIWPDSTSRHALVKAQRSARWLSLVEMLGSPRLTSRHLQMFRNDQD
jgi:hypothetical protein